MKQLAKLTLLSSCLAMSSSYSASTEDRIKELEEKVENLEFQSYENFFKLNGTLETQFNSIKTEDKKAWSAFSAAGSAISNTADTTDRNKYYQLFFNLNMESHPNERLSFFGRMSTVKYWSAGSHTSTYSDNQTYSEFGQGASGNYSSGIYLERAFGNYKISDNLIFSMGRLPTIDGPPKHTSHGESLMGNYPQFGFAGIFDGAALTYATKLGSGAFRAKYIYTPFQTLDFENTSRKLTDSAGKQWDTTTDANSLILEYENDNLSFARKFMAMFQFFHMEGMPLYAKSKTIQLSGTTPSACAAASECPTIVTQSNLSIGLTRYVLHLELNDIANSGLDFSVQYLTGKTKSNGLITISAATGTVFSGGWMTNKTSDEKTGGATLVNLRYRLPFSSIKNPYFGYEFLTADKEAFMYDIAGTDPVGFYTTRDGQGHHMYWIQPFSGNLKMRLGYMRTTRDSANALYGLIGDFQNIDRTRQGVYTNITMSF